MHRHSTASYTAERGKMLARSLLVGIILTLILTCIELGLFWLINPNHLLGTGFTHQLPTLLALPVHFPVLWLIPVIELAGTTVAAFMATRPLALRAYLRDMQREQERYRITHTSLASFANVYHTPVTYYPNSTDVANSNVQTQAQGISLLNVLQQQESHLLLLGDAGAGKTLALHLYLSAIAHQGWTQVRSRDKIPVYIPLQDYSAFLLAAVKASASNHGNVSNPDEVTERATLLDFLYETSLPGMQHLRPHLNSLLKQGRLELLCDGLEEVASAYRMQVSRQLTNLMMITQDRFVIAARSADYAASQQLVDLVDGGFAARAIIGPLSSQAMRECIEQFIETQDNGWHYTAGQLMQIITTTRLRYLCSSPLLLFMLLEMIQATNIDRAKVLDTRGRLVQAYVMQRITHEQRQSHWNTETPPTAEELVRFLSTVACAARWAGSFNAIQLIFQSGHVQPATEHGGSELIAEALLAWLDEHPAHSAFSLEQLPQSLDQQTVALMLRFAQSAALLDINAEGMLSFRHEMIAAYLCAEYFQTMDRVGKAGITDITANSGSTNSNRSIPTSSVTQQFFSDGAQWSEVIALWAGLLDNPAELAENFIALGLLDGHTGTGQNTLSALAFSLICSGVAWRLPQAEATHYAQGMQLPTRVVASMTAVVRNAPAREQLAQLFTLCAEESGQEIYRALLPLVMVEGIEEFLLLIDGTTVTDLLFTQLIETVDIFAYDAYVRRLCRILGMLGSTVVHRANELSQRAPSHSLRLRAAAINILGSTHDASAVAPLIARLSDNEPSVVDRAIHGLIRLGPALTLEDISSVLENTAAGIQAHRAALTILERFLSDKTTKNLATIKPGSALVEPQAQSLYNVRILHTIIATLAAPYTSEPSIQQQSKDILIRLGQEDNAAVALDVAQPDAQPTAISSLLIGLLTRYLSSNDDTMVRNAIQVLVQIGNDTVPTLLEQLNLQNSQLSEIVRVRMVEVLRTIHDPRALPTILHLLADSSLLVQQQVALTLAAYQPDSIIGLIDIILSGEDDMVVEKAAHLLGDMGTPSVEPIMQSLSHLTPAVSSRLDARRIRLLVYILERIHDARAIPVLVHVLANAQPEPLLAVAVIHALSQFQNEQVVPPLIVMLEQSNPQVYEEAIDALSHLGDLAFHDLIAALDVGQETVATSRIRRAILGMDPFPAERLITALQQSDRAAHRTFQVQQILAILCAQGADAAQTVVNHLFDNDSRLRDYTRRALSEMDAAIVVPALLEALDHEAWREGLAELLLNYPGAIPPLVALLGDMDRCDAALAILPRYGAMVLPSLISALDNANLVVQEQTQSIITTLVHQDASVLSQIVRLFETALPLRAHEALLEVLTNELADVSIPALLDGLEDAHLIEDVSIALARLANKRSAQPEVMQGLLDALHNKERRRGAETALIKIGGLAVQPVGALITDSDQEVAAAAQHVLGAIGVPALSFIWAAHGDTSNRPRREAAMSVFHAMPTNVIKDALVQLLSSELPDGMSMALSLLVERIHDESTLPPENQEMVPTLLEYVQIHEGERISMRIAALLVLVGGASVVNHIIQILYNYPEEYMYSEQLLAILFFLRRESQHVLAGLLNDPHAPTPLRAEAIALLGMMGRSKDVVDYAQSLSNYGLAAGRNNILYADQLTIALRALGSLLASGNWDVTTLLDMRRNYQQGTPQHELYSVLLGWRYEPELVNLENTLQNERDSHRRKIEALTGRIVSDQDQIADLENQLSQIRQEHGQRGDELYQTTQEREAIRGRLEQTTRENHALQEQIKQLQYDNSQMVRELAAWRASQGQ